MLGVPAPSTPNIIALALLVAAPGCEPAEDEPPQAAPGPAYCRDHGGVPKRAWDPPFPEGPPPPARFDDLTAARGLPEFFAGTASWGDVNGDDYPDLLVAGQDAAEILEGREVRLYISCADGFVLALDHGSEGTSFPLAGARASAIADVDADGRMDLILGYSDVTVVWVNEGDLRFTRVVAWAGTADEYVVPSSLGVIALGGQRHLYIAREDIVYAGSTPNPPGRNVILAVPDDPRSGPWPDVTDSFTTIDAGGQLNTLAFAMVPRGAFGLPPLLMLGNDFAVDHLYVHGGGTAFAELALPAFNPETATMGLDWRYMDEAGRVEIIRSDIGRMPLVEVSPDGATTAHGDRLVLDTAPITWGVVYADFDNDGDEDCVAAAGVDPLLHDGQSATPSTDDGRLIYLEASPDGSLVEASASAGPLFADVGADFFSVATADWDRDGCMDLLATPLEVFDDGSVMNTPVRVLRNRCEYPGGWVGLLLRDDPGAMVALQTRTADGTVRVRYRAVKAASSIAGRGDATALHFGLGDDVAIERATVFWADGSQRVVEGLALNGYHDLR